MKKRYITLLEIMIVIFLITIIGGVLGYNMKGSLEKGRAFKTQQAKRQIKDILLLEYAKGEMTIQEIEEKPKEVLEKSNLIKNVDKFIKDGWGDLFDIKYVKKDDTFKVSSQKYKAYKAKQKG